MNTIATKYSPSVNIIRDNQEPFNYIPTPNSTAVFNQLIKDLTSKNKSHIIIGTYGIGKSSLLLALKQTFDRFYNHFKFNKQNINVTYDFISIVGTYSSFTEVLSDIFLPNKKNYTTKEIIAAIDDNYVKLKKNGKGLIFIVDEFGKFLEYASKTNPEAELYFLQELSEWINDAQKNVMFIATLHQDFNAYSKALNQNQKQEWDKVKGRFKEIVFNEPVEQLLYLASERVHQKFNHLEVDKSFNKLFKYIQQSKAFPLRDYLEIDFAKKLYPFDILSAAVLTLALQRYGQNERSLFSFLESNNHVSINIIQTEKSYYSIDKVYDYLINSFYSVLTSDGKTADIIQWASIRKALERVEGVFPEELQTDAQRAIKVIGLLNVFASSAARLDDSFYENYLKYAVNVKAPTAILKELAQYKIIRYVKHSFRYVIFEGTDLNIDLAIDEAGRIVERTTNVVSQLNQHFAFPFIAAKSVFYKTGTPRFFQFQLSEQPITDTPEGEIDGFINLIFTPEDDIEQKVQETSKNCAEATLYGVYKNTTEIQNYLFEIQKVKKVMSENQHDRIALKYLRDMLKSNIGMLNHIVMDSLYSEDGNITWFYSGKKQNITSRQSFNKILSEICEQVYSAIPTLKNELINKTKVSGQISQAKNKLTELLLNNIELENLGFESTKFPPEKTIYLSLIRQTGLHQNIDGTWQWQEPTDQSFRSLWNFCEQFLDTTKSKERSLQELIDLLLAKPFKLKQGFIDFWIPIFLLAKSNDYALFDSNNYIPELSQDILELIAKKPFMFKVKAFDLSGLRLELFNRYRIFLGLPESSKPNNKIFIQTIKPFLSFYRSLPEYAKGTKGLSKQTLALRSVIEKTKDPEKTFFDDFPIALGYNLQELQNDSSATEQFIRSLQESIRELRSCYDALLNRFETFIAEKILGVDIAFDVYKQALKERYTHLKAHLLTSHHKVFYNRIISPLDDRASWLNSVSQASINKALTNIIDEDELVLYDKFKELIEALDNLTDISKVEVNEQQEEVIKVELTSLVNGLNQNILRLPKTATKEIDNKQREIKAILGKDKKTNVAVLAMLLQEYLSHE